MAEQSQMTTRPAASDVEEYKETCSREVTEERLDYVEYLEACLKPYKTPAERREVLHHILEMEGYEDDYEKCDYWAAYMSRHPEDLPNDHGYNSFRDAAEKAEYYVPSRQQELFGDWKWPTSGSTAANWPVDTGPRGEEVPILSYNWDLTSSNEVSTDTTLLSKDKRGPGANSSKATAWRFVQEKIFSKVCKFPTLCRKFSRILLWKRGRASP